MRRLFSTLATGLPGAGLLVMRLVVGTVLVGRGIAGLTGDAAIGPTALLLGETALGGLLIAGLWTPIAGTLVAMFEHSLPAGRRSLESHPAGDARHRAGPARPGRLVV